MNNTNDYILWSAQKGGWLTKAAFTHSDYRQAQVFTLEDAIGIVRLHEGRLIPVNLQIYTDAIKGVKLS